LHQYARDGVVLLGHVRDAQNGQIFVALDLKETLARVDQFESDTLKLVDDYIIRTGLCAPLEVVPKLRDGYEQERSAELDLNPAGISNIIWATGYTYDFSMVKLPVMDSDGYPLQKRGVTRFEGLYFLGMPWLHKRKSGIRFGVGDDAAYLVQHIASRVRSTTAA
jgi:putative flavoprotein involved in K+ transport